MIRKRVEKDEWYPVYSLEEPWPHDEDRDVIVVPEDLWERHQRLMAEFDALQNVLRALYK